MYPVLHNLIEQVSKSTAILKHDRHENIYLLKEI